MKQPSSRILISRARESLFYDNAVILNMRISTSVAVWSADVHLINHINSECVDRAICLCMKIFVLAAGHIVRQIFP